MNELGKTIDFRERPVVEARPHQIETEVALKLQPIDLLKDEDTNGKKLLSRADLILIFTLYKNGLEQFLEEYKSYVMDLKKERGYVVVNKPHYYLKGIID